MSISRLEQETVIVFNEQEQEAIVETFKSSFIKKLDNLCNEYPDKFKFISEDTEGCRKYIIPKKYIRIGSPRSVSDEQREAMSERAKKMWEDKNDN